MTVVTIPQSALVPSDYYYTDLIGGGLGTLMITTGGGNGANVGDPSGRNDDGFRGPIDFGFTIDFFNVSYTSFWLNNNGNISFDGGIAAFTPAGPQGALEPIISPFFADVDTRNSASGLVYYRSDIPNQWIITWDAVGYFSEQINNIDSFQLVVRGPDYVIPPGEGTIGFFYKSMQWETGDASGGTGGFGGTPAAVGFGDGLSNGVILEGSTDPNISVVVNNTHLWVDSHLSPITTVTLSGVESISATGDLTISSHVLNTIEITDIQVTVDRVQTPNNDVTLRWSDDAGASWSNGLLRSMGAPGEYFTTPTWFRLGMSRNRIFELSWSGPNAEALQGVFVEYSVAAT